MAVHPNGVYGWLKILICSLEMIGISNSATIFEFLIFYKSVRKNQNDIKNLNKIFVD